MNARSVAVAAERTAPSARPPMPATLARSQLPALHAGARRRVAACNGVERKKEGTSTEKMLQVPDAALAKDIDPTEPAQAGSAGSGSESEGEPQAKMTAEEIGAQMSQLRAAAKEQQSKDGFVEGVMEEVRLIKWPEPKSALLNTVLVVTVVAGTSAVLFGVNTLLAEISRVVYSSG